MVYQKTSVLETKKEKGEASKYGEETVDCSIILYLFFFTLPS